MATLKQYDVGDHTWNGPTMREAKLKAECAIQQAFTGEYAPTVLFWRNHTLVVYRTATGWTYRIIFPEHREEGKPYKARAFSYYAERDYDNVYHGATVHLAQIAWQHEDGVSIPDFVTEKDAQQTVASWQRWQLRYRFFKEQGHDEDRLHDMASDYRNVTPFDRLGRQE